MLFFMVIGYEVSWIGEEPKSAIRLLCANMLWNKSDHFSPWHSSSTLGLTKWFFLSSVFPLIGNNGTPLRPQNVKTSISSYHHNAHGRFGLKRGEK